MALHHTDLARMFDDTAAGDCTLRGATLQRWTAPVQSGLEIIVDRFADNSTNCAFARFCPTTAAILEISVDGSYSVATVAAGGWILRPTDSTCDLYWIPQSPKLRRLDDQGHILEHAPAASTGMEITSSRLALTLPVAGGEALDLVVWRIPAAESDFIEALDALTTLECQPYFLWSSHTTYSQPSDMYLHLVHGHVYENHEVWPRYWQVCSELDAYALYLVLSGLERATGKRLYTLLKRQVVFSVIARQAADGGWYHGEWTDSMESHFRLHTGGTLMLADFLEESDDDTVRTALTKAVDFSVRATDKLDHGVWFLHDSLEISEESAKTYPFHWVPGRAFGKSPTNMLILNTHLDTSVAVERYMRVTGDWKHAGLIGSARELTRVILDSRPAEWLYRMLFGAIDLTLLPKAAAQALPLPLRAIKRVAWKYLIPILPDVKARFPRIVMPGGFIDRSLAQAGMSYRYQPVNLMDLIRTRRIFDDAYLDELLTTSFAFTQESGIRMRWKELRGKEDDSLGFWCEALYHLCLSRNEPQYRAWLAEAMIDLSDNELGLSPSLLGANREAIPDSQQVGCPVPLDGRLRIANLSRNGIIEIVVVNPTTDEILLEWAKMPRLALEWASTDGPDSGAGIPPRGWLWGIGAAAMAPNSTTPARRDQSSALMKTAQ